MFFLALAYLAIPVFILIFSLFSWPFVVGATIALAVLIFDVYRQLPTANATPIPSLRNSYPLILITVFLVAVGVICPYDHVDWEKSIGVFNLLRDAEFPPIFTRLDGEPRLLRYYLGWYIVPSISARFGGDFLLTPVIFLSTTFGIVLALLMTFAQLKSRGAFLVAAITFFLFSGLDIIGVWVTGRYNCCSPFDLFQWYVSWGAINPPLLGTSMHPQHALPAWLGVGMLLAERRLTLRYSVLIGAVILMWSPIVAIGLIPIYVWATVKEGLKTIITPANTIAAPLVAISIVSYLTQSTGAMPFFAIWEVASISRLLMFFLLEFLVIAIAIYQARREDNQLLSLSVICLLVFSLISYGVVNDFIIRVTMPYVFILAFLAVKAVIINRGSPRTDFLTICLIVGAIPIIVSLFNGVVTSNRIDRSLYFGNTWVVNDPRFSHQHSINPKTQVAIGGVPLMRSQD